MKQLLTVIGLGLLLAGCVYSNGYEPSGYYGYSAQPGSYGIPYGSHGWPDSPFNGGDGPGTPGIGTPG